MEAKNAQYIKNIGHSHTHYIHLLEFYIFSQVILFCAGPPEPV